MYYLEIVLSPIVWVMKWTLELYVGITGSTGLSILLVSFTFAILLLPLRKMAQVLEQRISAKTQLVNEEVAPLKQTLKGEKLFLETEKIYEKHGYHPIQSIGLGASFFVMLPVLISAIILFTGDVLASKSFLFIEDLSLPDHLLGPINLLPLIMTGITIIDAKMRFKDDKSSRYRFYVIAVVLLALVYSLASGLVLYWTGSNVMSLILSKLQKKEEKYIT